MKVTCPHCKKELELDTYPKDPWEIDCSGPGVYDASDCVMPDVELGVVDAGDVTGDDPC